MPTDDTSTTEDELRERISTYLQRNFPQIKMHGGSAVIQNIDAENGSVTIQLGGACSGCGISPMTIKALQTKMTDDIDGIETVNASTGMNGSEGMVAGASGGMSPSFPNDVGADNTDDDDDGTQAPF